MAVEKKDLTTLTLEEAEKVVAEVEEAFQEVMDNYKGWRFKLARPSRRPMKEGDKLVMEDCLKRVIHVGLGKAVVEDYRERKDGGDDSVSPGRMIWLKW